MNGLVTPSTHRREIRLDPPAESAEVSLSDRYFAKINVFVFTLFAYPLINEIRDPNHLFR